MCRITNGEARKSSLGIVLRNANLCLLFLSPLLLAGCYGLGTTYAPGYTEQGFDSIEIGDTKAHVIAVLGEPLRIVGHLYIYSYFDKAVWFTVNTQTGDVELFRQLDSQSEESRKLYEGIESIDQLTKTLGLPDKISGAHSGQSNNPEVLSYVYSEESGHWWKVRVVFVNKTTEVVVDKWAYNMTD